MSITKAQPPFQPGSTPFSNRKRYLGRVTLAASVSELKVNLLINEPTTSSVSSRSLTKIRITSSTSSFSINLYAKVSTFLIVISMSLATWVSQISHSYVSAHHHLVSGERGAVFACQPENEHPARINFRPYTNFTSNSWYYTLSRKGARCLGIAVGGSPLTAHSIGDIELEGYGHVVVATSEHDLTFLSGTGRERRIMALPGEFVTMVANAEWVFIVHRAGSTTIDGQLSCVFTCVPY